MTFRRRNSNIHLIGVERKREREREGMRMRMNEAEDISEIMAENFL